MKALRLPLLVLAASLGLAACDHHNDTVTHVVPPQASAPEDTARSPATNTAAKPVTDPSGTSANAAAPQATATAPTANAPAPQTNAMGAQPVPGAPAAVAPDGTAAPTELQRFLEETASRKAS